jgi:hypothetical protein
MSVMMPGLPVAADPAVAMLFNSYQSNQQAIARHTSMSIEAMWMSLVNPEKFSNSWRILEPIVSGIIDTHYQMSAADAATYYGMSRATAGLYGGAVPGAVLDPGYLSHVTNVMGVGQFYHFLKGHDALTSSGMARKALSGAAVRMVLNGGRSTVTKAASGDNNALGWERIIEAKPCGYCSGLAASSSVRKATSDVFHAHDDCQCLARVVFKGQTSANTDLASEWARVTSGKTGKAANTAWDRYWSEKNDNTDSEGSGRQAPQESTEQGTGDAAVVQQQE